MVSEIGVAIGAFRELGTSELGVVLMPDAFLNQCSFDFCLNQSTFYLSEQIRNAVKCDPRWRSLIRSEHRCRRQRAHPVFLIQLVHRFQQLRPALRVVERIKQIQRMQPVRNQPVQAHADKVRLVVSLSFRLVCPQPAQRANQRLVILALTQPYLVMPPARRNPKSTHRRVLSPRH